MLSFQAEFADTPLAALGVAERLAETAPAQALPLFERALSADLRGLRTQSRVALGAARTAQRLGETERALGYLDAALGDPETRESALEISAQLATTRARLRSSPPQRRISSSPPASPSFDENSRVATAGPAGATGRYSQRPPAAEWFGEVIEPAPVTRPLRSLSPRELGGMESVVPRSPRPAFSAAESSLPVPSTPPPSPRRVSPMPLGFGSIRPQISGRYSVAPEGPENSVPRPSEAVAFNAEVVHAEPVPAEPALPSVRPPFESNPELRSSPDLSATFVGEGANDEQALYDALRGGSIAAGLELARQLEHRSGRAHDLVSVERRLALLQPGDLEAVSRLHGAALADRDLVYARAVEHVVSVLHSGEGTSPPALSDQPEQPDAVRALLFKDQTSRAIEALSLVWEGAEHVFRRDPSTYGVTGLERVPASAPTPLARSYAALGRALGLLRTPLFQRRSAGPVTVSLALLSPPAVILSGDVRQDSGELRFHLGAMLAAATPQFALLFGSPESQGRAVLRGLAFAFGPPRAHAGSPGAAHNLAEVLWESIPARLQRRLRELCDDPDSLDYDVALGTAKVAVRRAGFFAAGDFGTALRQVALEEEYPLGTPGHEVPTFIRDNLTARNLYSLALGPEYAHTRWQFGRGGSHRSG